MRSYATAPQPRQQALDAAAQIIGATRRRAYVTRVSGTMAGVPITFSLSVRGWKVAIAGVQSRASYDVRRADAVALDEASVVPDRAFRARYVVDGAPAHTVRAALGEDLRARILALGPHSIRLRGGVLVVEKQYEWFFGDVEDVEAGIALAVDLVRAARIAPMPELQPAVTRGGDPYRASLPARTDVDAELRAELTGYERRFRRRRRVQVARSALKVAWIGGLFFVWPIGLLVWGRHISKRGAHRERLLAAARDDAPPTEGAG